MAVKLAENRYGKSQVRLVKVERHGSRHEVRDLSVNVRLTGDFAAAYLEGDNRRVVATDTMKNTVYALARQPLGEIEQFGQRLTNHFLGRNPQVSQARVEISQNLWTRLAEGAREHDHAFSGGGAERRTTLIEQDRSTLTVKSGIAGLTLLKTADSAFEGFVRDEFTTLEDARDRLLRTRVGARWTYAPGDHEYGILWRAVRGTILEVFAAHKSRGIQHTVYACGEMVLERIPEISRIELSLPNLHCHRVDLTPFGLDNPNQVFAPAEEPSGLIEAVLERVDRHPGS